MAHVWLPEPRLVLLVEPVGSMLVPFRELLAGYGIDAMHAEAFDDALTLLQKFSIDIAVLHAAAGVAGSIPFLSHVSQTGTPVIVVSEQAGDTDRILTLERGADDYLVAPYNPHELLARARAIVRRLAACQKAGEVAGPPTIRVGPWTVDLAGRTAVRQAGEHVVFTAGEAQLLMVLAEHAGEVLSREQLAARTHQDAADVFDRSVDVLIARIRRKLEDDSRHPRLIETIRGAGYRLTQRPPAGDGGERRDLIVNGG